MLLKNKHQKDLSDYLKNLLKINKILTNNVEKYT